MRLPSTERVLLENQKGGPAPSLNLSNLTERPRTQLVSVVTAGKKVGTVVSKYASPGYFPGSFPCLCYTVTHDNTHTTPSYSWLDGCGCSGGHLRRPSVVSRELSTCQVNVHVVPTITLDHTIYV